MINTPNHILIVDDDEIMRSLFEDLFFNDTQNEMQPHYILKLTSTTDEALSVVKNEANSGTPIKVAFIDIQLKEEMNGLQLANKILDSYKNTAIVIMTGHSEYHWENIVRITNNNSNAIFLKKPLDTLTIRQITVILCTMYDQRLSSSYLIQNLEREVTIRTDDLNKTIYELAKAKDQAEKLNNSKTNFLSMISHELRTPMTAAISMVHILMKTKLDKTQEEYIDIINCCLNNQSLLLENIIEFSNSQNENKKTIFTQFDLHTLLYFITASHSNNILQNKNTFNVKIDANMPKFMYGNPSALKSVINNIISNANKFTENGKISFTCTYSLDKNGKPNINISISDTGQGIATDKINTIFDEFYQEENVMTRKHGGIGIGLTLSRRLVEKMDGTLTLSSVAGSGTEVKIVIPFLDKIQTTTIQTENIYENLNN